MSFEESILLSLKREFSGSEKYRFFLRQLDAVEIELAQERKKNLELLRATSKLIDEIEQLKSKIGEYIGSNGKEKFVPMKDYKKQCKKVKKWMDLYTNLCEKLQS